MNRTSVSPLESSTVRIPGAALARCLLAALIATAALAPAAATAQDAEARTIPNSKCLNCHDDDELTTDDGKSMAIHEAEFAGSKHRRVDCVECHKDALEIRHPRNDLGPVPVMVCEDCHADEIAPLRTSAHAKKATPDADAASCGKCHGNVHTLPRRPGLEAPLSSTNQMETCGQCHGDMMEGYLHSSHAKARLVKGLTSAPGCTDCHGGHDILPKSNPESRTSHAKSPEMCGDCHGIILDQWEDDSAHGTLWKEGKDGPVCTTCHQAHDIQDPTSQAMRQEFPNECGTCHEDVLKTYRHSFHGKMTELGYQASRDVLGLPYAARQPAGVRSALEHPPGQSCGDLRHLPRERDGGLPDLRPAQRSGEPGRQHLRVLDLHVHDRAADRRVRLLRPAHAALVAAHAGRQAARRVQDTARRPGPVRAALHEHADRPSHDHRGELPAAGGHRPAAEVPGGARGRYRWRTCWAGPRPRPGCIAWRPSSPSATSACTSSACCTTCSSRRRRAISGAGAPWCRSRATSPTCGRTSSTSCTSGRGRSSTAGPTGRSSTTWRCSGAWRSSASPA